MNILKYVFVSGEMLLGFPDMETSKYYFEKKKRRKERSNFPKFFNNAMPSKFVLFIILSKLFL